MAEANLEQQQQPYHQDLIQELKSHFLNYEISPGKIAESIQCFTPHDKDVICRKETTDLELALDEFFNRLTVRPIWLNSLILGIRSISNPSIFPPHLCNVIADTFCTVQFQIEPAYITDDNGRTCLSDQHCSPVLSRRALPVEGHFIDTGANVSHSDPKTIETASARDVGGPGANVPQTEPKAIITTCTREYLQRQIKSRYSVFKKNLHALPQFVDHLRKESVLSQYDVEDIHACRHQREMIDCLLKKLLMEKGYDGCKVFTDVICTEEFGSQDFILKTPNETFDTNGTDTQMKIRNTDILDYMPNLEKLIDLMVETDAFSIHEHDEVFKTKTRKEQLQVMIRQITTKDKVNVFLQALNALGCKSVVKYLRGFSDSPVSNADEKPLEPSLEIDGSSLLMDIDDAQNTHFDLTIRVNSQDPQSIENRIRDSFPNAQNAEVDQLADQLAKLSIYDVVNGSVIIELKAKSGDSLHLLRKAYLDGTLNDVIKQMLTHMGINMFVDEGGLSIEVEIGITADREKRKEANKSEHAEILKLNQAFLLEELDPFPILKAMKSKEVFTEQQIMWLLEKEPRSRKARVKEILNLLRWMHTSTFEIFMTSLKEGTQSYIYHHLQRKCSPEVIRKLIKENEQKIIAEMDISMLRDLCRRCLYCPPKGTENIADYKQHVLNHILTSSNEVVLSFEDVIYAAGLGHLLQEHEAETVQSSSSVESPTSSSRTILYKKIFEDVFQRERDLISSKENMGKNLSIKLKNGKLFCKFCPRTLLELEAIREYCHKIESDILGFGEKRTALMKQISEKYEVNIEDMGILCTLNESTYDVSRTWLLKESSRSIEAFSSEETYLGHHYQDLPAILRDDPLLQLIKENELLKGVQILGIKRCMTDTDEQPVGSKDSYILDVNRYIPQEIFQSGWHSFLKLFQIVSALGSGTITAYSRTKEQVTFELKNFTNTGFRQFVLDISDIVLDELMVDDLCTAFLSVKHTICLLKIANASLDAVAIRNLLKPLMGSNISQLCLNGNNVHHLEGVGLLGLNQMLNLEVLELNQCGLLDKDMKTICSELPCLEHLLEIDFGNNNFSVDGLKDLQMSLQNTKSVRALRLQKNKIGVEGGEVLSEMLLKMPNIEIINLSGCKLGDNGIMLVSKVLANRHIRKLNLRENDITLNTTKLLFVDLQNSSNLQHFDFSSNEIGASVSEILNQEKPQEISPTVSVDAAPEFLKLLKVNSSSWDYLCLWNCGLGQTNIFQDTKSLKSLEGLTSLCLQGNKLKDDVAEVLGSCMKTSWRSLRHLNLRKNCISDNGAKALTEGFEVNVMLEEVYLDRNQVKLAETLIAVHASLSTSDHKYMQTLDISLNELFENPSSDEHTVLKRKLEEGIQMKNIIRDGRITTVTRGSFKCLF